jgi:hypothetical protein
MSAIGAKRTIAAASHQAFATDNDVRRESGGWGEIRTHGGVAATPVFKTGALNHSATHPVVFRIANCAERRNGRAVLRKSTGALNREERFAKQTKWFSGSF